MKESVSALVHARKSADKTDADGAAVCCVLPRQLAETLMPVLDLVCWNTSAFQYSVRKTNGVCASRRRIPPLQCLRREVMDSRCAGADSLQLDGGDAAKNGSGNIGPSSRA